MTETKSGIEAIIVDDLDEAKQVMGSMRERISLYGFASVSDLYDLIGVTGNFYDTRWGWRNTLDFANSKIEAVDEGFQIAPPRAQPLNQNKANRTLVKLMYHVPSQDAVIDTNMVFHKDGDSSRERWLHNMVERNPDTIFFYVVETTDIPEEAFS